LHALGSESKQDMFKLLETAKIPLVETLDSANVRRIMGGEDENVVVLAAVDGVGQTKEIVQSLNKASKEYRRLREAGQWKGSAVGWAVVNAVEWKDYLQAVFQVTSAPKIIIVDAQNDVYYAAFTNNTEITPDTLMAAVTKASNGGKGLATTYSQPFMTRAIKRFGRHAAKLGTFFIAHPFITVAICAAPVVALVAFLLLADDKEFQGAGPMPKPVAKPVAKEQ